DIRRHPDGVERYEVLAQVRNFGAKTVRTALTLELGETVLARQELELEAGGRQVLVYPFEGAIAGTLSARLEMADDFATDDRAVLSVSAAAPLRILYVGPGNPFLSSLLRFFPGAQVTAVESWQADETRRQGGHESIYDVLIFDRVKVPELTEGNVILINTVAPNLPLHIDGELRTPRIRTPLAKHPLTAGLNLGDLHVQDSLRVSAWGDGIVLARAANSPLLVAWERPKLRALFIGFDIMASDLPFRVAFPVLFHNAFEWFHPQHREFPADGVRAGAPMPIFVPPGDRELEIMMPSGRKELLEVVKNPLIYSETLEAGVYTYKSAGREGRFTVNLFDEEESDIRARVSDTPAVAAPAAEERSAAEMGFSLWPFLLVAVFLVLAVELILAYRIRLAFAPVVLRACA
ncbi:MAG: hypothetical protein ACREQV_11520, partial [Candidatus Binatia bacterium]